jgi:hypothetical protein
VVVIVKELHEVTTLITLDHVFEVHDDQIVVVHCEGLLIHEVEQVLNAEPGIVIKGMRKRIHEIEVHGVDQGGFLHPKTTFLEGFFFGS